MHCKNKYFLMSAESLVLFLFVAVCALSLSVSCEEIIFVYVITCSILYVWIMFPLLLWCARDVKFRCFSLSMYSKFLSSETSLVALCCTFSSALMSVA